MCNEMKILWNKQDEDMFKMLAVNEWLKDILDERSGVKKNKYIRAYETEDGQCYRVVVSFRK